MIEMPKLALTHPPSSSAPLPRLQAAGKVLAITSNRMGWLAPTPGDAPLPLIRERLREHGYVWLKGFLPPAEVGAFRAQVFGHLTAAGFVADPLRGIASGVTGDKELANKLLMEFVRSARYEAFCMHPRLWQFMDELLGGLSYLHKRKIMRYTLPATAQVTPAHYDLVYLRGGTDRIVTAWIPIGDVPVEMGGLVYLEGSHVLGVKMEAEFRVQNASLPPEERINAYNKNMTDGGYVSKDLPDMADKFDTRWLVANYEAGDVMLHSPYMIHASTMNEDKQGRIRLSTDIRYQNVSDEIDARWANHWTLDDML
jgi:ectoine hydroxylase-related dioxygenase (phytanoyl-CoA dioxygenase family)